MLKTKTFSLSNIYLENKLEFSHDIVFNKGLKEQITVKCQADDSKRNNDRTIFHMCSVDKYPTAQYLSYSLKDLEIRYL